MALLCAVALASLRFGAVPITFTQVWAELQAGRGPSDSPVLGILFQQRLPRTLAALLAGGGLALAGCVFQTVLRNPLATPYTLGVASAAALGAWLSLILIDAGYLPPGALSEQALAFAFALGNVGLIHAFISRGRRVSPTVLLLAGVTLGMLSNAGIMLSRYFAQPDRVIMMDRWLLGGVDVLGHRPVLLLLLGSLPCWALLLAQAQRYDQYAFSEELAEGRGVNTRALLWVTFIGASLLTAVVVSAVGPIGFIGLIVPHAVRALTGPGHRVLMPISMLAGGVFLCGCDLLARVTLPGEVPVGIITTLIGAPAFLVLLLRGRLGA